MSDALGRRSDAARSLVADRFATVVEELVTREDEARRAARSAIERTRRLESAVAELESQKAALSARDPEPERTRRHTSRRIEGALARLERRAEELAASLEERVAAALEQLEDATAAIAESERRVLAAEERVALMRQRAVDAAAAADRGEELEEQLRRAARRGEEAAARISTAERRLFDRADPEGSGE